MLASIGQTTAEGHVGVLILMWWPLLPLEAMLIYVTYAAAEGHVGVHAAA